MPRIELVYFNAGGGHRAAARALDAAITRRHPDWQISAVNLFDVLDPQGQFRRLTGVEPEDFYNLRLKKGWTAGLAQELKILQASIRVSNSFLVQRLIPHWLDSAPDLVVSLIPNFNRPLIDSLNAALPGVSYLTVMTDLADHPPSFWIEPDSAQHVVCGTDRAVAQARSMGVAEARVHRASGMVLHPDFYGPVLANVAAERAVLGLDPKRRTGIVMFGGHGSPAMETIARLLDDVQLVLMCGHNEELAARLRSMKAAAPRAVLGFTPQVRKYMQLGDFFIGKPGPGSLSEAIHLGLPVITFRNAWTMPQERYNTDWVRDKRLGLVVKSAKAVRPAALALIEAINDYQASVSQLRNTAVFEVVDLIKLLLRSSSIQERPGASRARSA
jgi:hypothetical protein